MEGEGGGRERGREEGEERKKREWKKSQFMSSGQKLSAVVDLQCFKG